MVVYYDRHAHKSSCAYTLVEVIQDLVHEQWACQAGQTSTSAAAAADLLFNTHWWFFRFVVVVVVVCHVT